MHYVWPLLVVSLVNGCIMGGCWYSSLQTSYHQTGHNTGLVNVASHVYSLTMTAHSFVHVEQNTGWIKVITRLVLLEQNKCNTMTNRNKLRCKSTDCGFTRLLLWFSLYFVILATLCQLINTLQNDWEAYVLFITTIAHILFIINIFLINVLLSQKNAPTSNPLWI